MNPSNLQIRRATSEQSYGWSGRGVRAESSCSMKSSITMLAAGEETSLGPRGTCAMTNYQLFPKKEIKMTRKQILFVKELLNRFEGYKGSQKGRIFYENG
jgi:hypothetical protein